MSKIICVLGMHRSGTSCLAGSLQEAGLFLGEVNTAAPFNAKGNREDARIWALHDQILADNGGNWMEPPDHIAWSDAHRAQRDAVIQSHAAQPCWGFKDPRTLLMFDFWEEAIPDLRPVGDVPPPVVGGGLAARPGGAGYAILDRSLDPLQHGTANAGAAALLPAAALRRGGRHVN